MTDQLPAQQGPVFALQRAFLKGASLEIPGIPEVFQPATPPHVDVNLGLTITRVGDVQYEVVIRGTVTFRPNQEDTRALLVLEADQAGVFEVRNIPEEHLPEVLEVGAPSILAPYLRVVISDMLTRATLPPFYIPEINWAAVRQQNLQANQAAAQALEGRPVAAQVH